MNDQEIELKLTPEQALRHWCLEKGISLSANLGKALRIAALCEGFILGQHVSDLYRLREGYLRAFFEEEEE